LIKRVVEALRSTGGAAGQYQHAIVEVESLDRTLKAVAALVPTASNANHVNAIRAMALTCQFPLRRFLESVQDYENSLGSFAPRNSLTSVSKKAKWAVHTSKQIEVLRAMITAKVISINLLLNLHIS
jgi:hypothetical protein